MHRMSCVSNRYVYVCLLTKASWSSGRPMSVGIRWDTVCVGGSIAGQSYNYYNPTQGTVRVHLKLLSLKVWNFCKKLCALSLTYWVFQNRQRLELVSGKSSRFSRSHSLRYISESKKIRTKVPPFLSTSLKVNLNFTKIINLKEFCKSDQVLLG